MDYITITIRPTDLIAILNAADKAGRKYSLARKQKGLLTIDGEQIGVVLLPESEVVLLPESDEWDGPPPEISLNRDGTWTCTLELRFG